MSLLVSGTVALDSIKTPFGLRPRLLGGSASHFCMSASLFTEVSLSGVIGKDFPKKYLKLFESKKINLDSLVYKDGKTFHWNGEYKKGDFNNAVTNATELGVLEGFIPNIVSAHRLIPNVFLANDDPEIQRKVLESMKCPRLVGLDSMNLWIEHKKSSLLKLIKKVDLFVANDAEARALSGEDNLIKAAKALRKLGPKMIIVKKGEHGVLFYSDNLMFSYSAYPIEKVVDPTGAGDTFAGGLMGYLSRAKTLNHQSLKQALCYATILSSFNVEGFGVARTSKLTMAEVNERKKKFIEFISYK
ncbi:MAG: PfkB family carbohydrate kinase [Candidatus Omnitrophica bacterium]|nr:PfkB family carbohydrate kinase [Candidatus Omnitrophota bacterium]